jgi:putative ABC transport system permease protein
MSVIVSAAVLFNAFNIMDNNEYVNSIGGTGQTFQSLLMFVTILSMFIVFFSNSYFITGKSKEFAIGQLSGMSSYRIVAVLCFQTLIIGVAGSLLGIVLGIAAMPGISAVMYKILGVQGNIISFSTDTLIVSLIVNVFIICSCVIIGDYAHLTRGEIKDLINDQKQMYSPKKKVDLSEVTDTLKDIIKINPTGKEFKPSKITSFILYFIPVSALFLKFQYFYVMLFLFMIISVIGIHRLLKYYVPEKIMDLKNGKYAEDKIKLVSLSNLHYSLRKANFLIITLALSSVSLVYTIGMYKDLQEAVIMGIFVYVYSILSMGASILYKFIIEASYRKHMFKQLKLMGYSIKQIKRIMKEEIMMLYGVAIIVPLVHILIFIIKFQIFGIVTTELAVLLLGIFVGIFIIMIPVSYAAYKKLAL